MAPSILSADFTRLAEAIAMVETAGADVIHVDVMDGHFVPNLTIGPPVIRALKRIATVPLDVHLMIDNVESTLPWYLEAGADMVSFHIEACHRPHAVVRQIRDAGAKPGVAINPGTPVSSIADFIEEVDTVLVMSVNPGFGGQSFIQETVGKIEEIAATIKVGGYIAVIEVDGGIDVRTAPIAVAAGARLLVAGNAVFGAPDPAAALRAIRDAGATQLRG
jgi:ribulose-phosphate 3-epimerase